MSAARFHGSGASGSSSREIPSQDGAANPVASIGGVGHRKPPEGAGSHPATPAEASPRLDLGGQPAIAAWVYSCADCGHLYGESVAAGEPCPKCDSLIRNAIPGEQPVITERDQLYHRVQTLLDERDLLQLRLSVIHAAIIALEDDRSAQAASRFTARVVLALSCMETPEWARRKGAA